jgi:hypothetical protein
MSYELAIVKSVGENEVILVVGERECIVPLTPDQAKGLHQVLLNNENVLIPFNEYDKKIYLDVEEEWTESDLEELQGNDDYEIDDEGKVS